MKSIFLVLGLVFPSLVTKVIAQDIRFKPIDLANRQHQPSLSFEAKNKIKLYEICSDEARHDFLIQILKAGTNPDSTLTQIQLRKQAEQILELSLEEQKDAIIDIISKGGIEWGKVIDPSDHF